MPNDARLGLVVGVTLVILVAILFARKDGSSPVPPGTQGAASALSKVGLAAPGPGRPGCPSKTAAGTPRTHTVEEGDSLMHLSVRYYGDAGHVSYLFRANQDRILAPDKVPTGTVLRIPDAPRDPPHKIER